MNKDNNQNMANINAYRMDGLGNNFIIIDRRQNPLEIKGSTLVSEGSPTSAIGVGVNKICLKI